MNAMQNILGEFLANSTPEQLRAELNKGNRPFFQTLTDSDFVCFSSAPALPDSIPATVSFFRGNFVEDETEETWNSSAEHTANEELSLAA
jgi:hypothetical protein